MGKRKYVVLQMQIKQQTYVICEGNYDGGFKVSQLSFCYAFIQIDYQIGVRKQNWQFDSFSNFLNQLQVNFCKQSIPAISTVHKDDLTLTFHSLCKFQVDIAQFETFTFCVIA